jgi:hypothetical protein
MLKNDYPMESYLHASLTEVVSAAHNAMRVFAKRNLALAMQNAPDKTTTASVDMVAELEARSNSIVSLRDIQRVLHLFDYFLRDIQNVGGVSMKKEEQFRRSMLLAVGLVYYLKLDRVSRLEFVQMINALPTEADEMIDLEGALVDAMNETMQGTEIPAGIAITRGLKENVFATISCLFARVPLLIVGPPGTSKTLAVNIVADNANGSDSTNPYFRPRPRLDLFHYQCSKLSTSREIANVFDKAQQRQNRVDRDKHVCAVFMDEAGLADERRESLKVLHYLLEGHMSARPDVGFVAISNHVLDAAKSNRCVMLMRPEPDDEEMQSIASGILLGIRQDGQMRIHDFDVDGTVIVAREFVSRICLGYMDLLRTSGPTTDFGTWFGLRDFVYFLRYLREQSQIAGTRIILPIAVIVGAIERNFNGVCHVEFLDVTKCFLAKISPAAVSTHRQSFRHPIMVLKDALATTGHSNVATRPRFKMIIDGTEDDSTLRLLRAGNVVNVTGKSLFKLSNLAGNVEMERLRLISGVKYAALQGNLAVLSQTDPVNESFYDLTNQRFSEIIGRDGKPTFYTNIAVGGISR